MFAKDQRGSAQMVLMLYSEMCYLHRYKWLFVVYADDSKTMLMCGTYSSEEFTKVRIVLCWKLLESGFRTTACF